MKDITLVYLTMARIPGEKAHSIQIARTCSALAESGVNLILISPKRGDRLSKTASIKEVMNYYGLKTGFKHIRLLVPDILRGGRVQQYIAWLIMSLFFVIQSLILYNILRIFNRGRFYIFCREPLILTMLYLLHPIWHPHIVFELHELQSLTSKIFIKALTKSRLIICIAEPLLFIVKRLLGKEIVAKELKIETVHDAVDDSLFQYSNQQYGEEVSLSDGRKTIMYVGHLYEWKHPEFLIDVLAFLNREDVKLVFVGGNREDIKRVKKYAGERKTEKHVLFLDFVPPRMVPKFLQQADVLVHYSPKWTSLSPLKIFEYMLAMKPIVAPAVPGVCDVLENEKNALLFRPGDPVNAAEQISKVLDNPELAVRLGRTAFETARERFTYRARAKKIVELLSSLR